METHTVEYFDGKTKLKGFVATKDTHQKRPVVLVSHAWRGQDAFAREQAKSLANLGYVGFALDNYGNDTPISDDEAPNWMLPFFLNRPLLQKRIGVGFDKARELPYVDANQVGAIGFCFGGLSVIELLRSGKEVKGIVSFHAVIGSEISGQKAILSPMHPKAKGACLILHGNDDPLVSLKDLKQLEDEFSLAKLDWQIHTYGNCAHAFTNPEANNPNMGTLYDPRSAKRAFQSMQTFFKEIFS